MSESVSASRLAAALGHYASVKNATVILPYRVELKTTDDGLSRSPLKAIREFGWEVSGFTMRSKSVSVVRNDQVNHD